MPDTTQCPSCGALYDTRGKPPGNRVHCKKCGHSIIVGATTDLTMVDENRTLAEPRPTPPGGLDSWPLLQPESGDELKSGQILGKCRIERLLGRGGMGAVYLARHTTLDIPVAVKVLPPAVVREKPQFAERFVREARLAAKLQHPNLLAVKDSDRDPGTGLLYIVLEYIDGGSVRDRLNEGPLSVKEAVRIAIDTLRALAAAAKLGVVHRDIKPDNLMLTSDGQVKVADLGLAKDMVEKTDTTRTLDIMGTPAYMSPEQARDTKNVDIRADIYSLGATLYHMLTGEVPYAGRNSFEVLTRLATEPIPDPRRKRPEVPEALATVCRRALAKNPVERYQTPEAMIVELEASLNPPAGEAKSESRILPGAAMSGGAAYAEPAPAAKATPPKTEAVGPAVTCRACQSRIAVGDIPANQHCPVCDAVLDLSKLKAAPKPAASAARPAPGRPASAPAPTGEAEKAKTRCPHCSAKLTVPRAKLGKNLKCPKCGETFPARELKVAPTAEKAPVAAGKTGRAKKNAAQAGAVNPWLQLADEQRDSYWAGMAKAALYPFQTIGGLFIFVVVLPALIGFLMGLTIILGVPFAISLGSYAVYAAHLGLLVEILIPLAFFCSFLLSLVRLTAGGSQAAPVIQGMDHFGSLSTVISWGLLYAGLPGLFLAWAWPSPAGLFVGGLLLLGLQLLAPMGFLLSATVTPAEGLNLAMVGRCVAATAGRYFYMLLVIAVAQALFTLLSRFCLAHGLSLLSQATGKEFLAKPEFYFGVVVVILANILALFPYVVYARCLGVFLTYVTADLPYRIDAERASLRAVSNLTRLLAMGGILLMWLGPYFLTWLGGARLERITESGAALPTVTASGIAVGEDARRERAAAGNLQALAGKLAALKEAGKSYPATAAELAKLAGGAALLIDPRFPERPEGYVLRPLKPSDPAGLLWLYEAQPAADATPVHRALRHDGKRFRLTAGLLKRILELQEIYFGETEEMRSRIIQSIDLEWKKARPLGEGE